MWNLIDIKIVKKSDGIFTFIDIKGKSYDAKVSMNSRIMTYGHLQMFARMMNLWIMRLDDELQYKTNIEDIPDGHIIISVVAGSKEGLLKEAEKQIKYYKSEIADIEKAFSDSLKV